MIIDLRSDTFTKPTPAMLQAMASAPVGDDVFGEDPSVNALEEKAATVFGREAAIFCPSGTMTNQIAIKCHTNPGEEVICEQSSHVFLYEGGGIGFNSGCQAKTLAGTRGMLTAEEIKNAVNSDDVHRPPTTLVSLENTANRGGGACYDSAELKKISNACRESKIALHLDGARLFNAMVAQEESALDYGIMFDSISICLSKGLGAPVGSVLIGDTAFIKKARRIRKVLGGGMRQAGFIAAAGSYALDNHIDRLKHDHEHAKMIAEALLKKSFVGHMLPVETNIIIFEMAEDRTPQWLYEELKKRGILCFPISKTEVRMVTHLDVSLCMTEDLVEVIHNL